MPRYEVPSYLNYNVARTSEELMKYIRSQVDKAGADGVVVGLSGGVDSSVVTALATKALGVNKVHVLIMPDKESNPEDISDAWYLVRELGLINVRYIDITEIVEDLLRAFGTDYLSAPKLPKGNVKVRTRMILLYYLANTYNLLVLGTSDRSEYLLGFFTKWGDGAADIYPIVKLYKTQVRVLAEYLGIPERIAWKPSSPGLWLGHKASDELGAEYDIIDKVLYHLIDLKLDPVEVSRRTEVTLEFVNKIIRRIELNKHKRIPPEEPPSPIA